MKHFATPVDCDDAPRAVLVRARGCRSQQTFPPHTHRRSELVFVCSGALRVTAQDKVFTVPADNAILIPAGVEHDMRMLSDAYVMAAYTVPSPKHRAHEGCRQVRISGLLRELLQAATALPTAYDPDGRDGRIMALIAEEVESLGRQPSAQELVTPMPKDPRLLRICGELLDQLDRPWTIDEVAMAAGMGRRTFTRAFRREMGVSFATWLTQARLNAAVGRLNVGASITEVAFESGYNSPSAFATMFKRSLGIVPSSYQAAANSIEAGRI